MIFEAEETIQAPVETVWAHMTDPASMAKWMAGIDSMRTADGAPIDAGSQLIFSARGKERKSAVGRFEPRRAMTLISTQGPVTAEYGYRIVDGSHQSTTVALQADCTARGWFRLFLPLLKPMIRRVDGNQLADLKKLVES